MNVTAHSETDRKALRFAMTVSLVIGCLMFVMKVSAYLLTGSAAILSDAAESVVHVAAVFFAAYSLRLSYKPADDEHMYGHAKIAFFSAGFEGAMILLAALYIIYESIHKWMTGLHLENLGYGALLTAAATLINGALGGYLVWLGRRKHSLILEANGKHVLTDCWTSAAVLVGVGLAYFTKWLPWDPICGLIMAGNILVAGGGLIRAALAGLMDRADPEAHRQLVAMLERETAQRGLTYHALRHRSVGDAHWVELHFVFPEGTALANAHRTATAIEEVIEKSLPPRAHVTSHLECRGDHDVLHPHEAAAAAKPATIKPGPGA
jgi:cation diffusion facilitator family transporter